MSTLKYYLCASVLKNSSGEKNAIKCLQSSSEQEVEDNSTNNHLTSPTILSHYNPSYAMQSLYESHSPMMHCENQYLIDGTTTSQRRPSQHSSGYSSLENCMVSSDSQLLNYTFGNVIGKGNFSIVRKAEHLPTNMQVAIKIVEKTKLTAHDLGRISREVSILKCLHHKHITKMYQVLETATQIFIVMEYVPNGELFDYVSKRGKFSETDARDKFTQLLDAVEYCHEKGIVHRDLKMENILLDSNLNVKLADFGFGNYFDCETQLTTFCGSPPYAAPEIFQGVPYCGVNSDIWSLGVILYCMVVGGMPFEQECLPALRQQVLSGKFRVPYWVSLPCDNLIRCMLRVQPERRAGITQIRNHSWMRQSNNSHDHHNNTTNNGITSKQEQRSNIAKASLLNTPFPWNSQALEVMGRLGHPRQHIADLLHRQMYDHVMAHYLLLCDYFHSLRVTNSTPCVSSIEGDGILDNEYDTLADQLVRMGLTPESGTTPLANTDNSSNAHHQACVWLTRDATHPPQPSSPTASPIWLHRSSHPHQPPTPHSHSYGAHYGQNDSPFSTAAQQVGVVSVVTPSSPNPPPPPPGMMMPFSAPHSHPPPNHYRSFHLPHSITQPQPLFLGVPPSQRFVHPLHAHYSKNSSGLPLPNQPPPPAPPLSSSTTHRASAYHPMSPINTKPTPRWTFQSPVLAPTAVQSHSITPYPQRRRMSVACPDACNNVTGPSYSLLCQTVVPSDQGRHGFIRTMPPPPPILGNPTAGGRFNDRRASDISHGAVGLLPILAVPGAPVTGEEGNLRPGAIGNLQRADGVWELSHMTTSPYAAHYQQHSPMYQPHPLTCHSVTGSVIPENCAVDSPSHHDPRAYDFDLQYSDF